MTQSLQLPDQCVIAVYDALPRAESAIHNLAAAGFGPQQISLVSRHLPPDTEAQASLSLGDDSMRDAALGGALGGLTGMVGAATLITVTGIGAILMTGPLVALTGAIVGAFLGAMRGWGIHDNRIKDYERLVSDGRVLLVVTGDPVEVDRAEHLLQTSNALQVTMHSRASDESPEVDDRAKVGKSFG